MNKAIELTNISKKFRGEIVLDDISQDFFSGKIYGLVGRNGSGKSVLFKIICGYIIPDRGNVVIEGKELGKEYDFPDNLGALIEKPGFLWNKSAFYNLKLLADINHIIDENEIKESIRMVGLDPESNKRVGKYSLGMKQRLGIAQAIMERPDILILDEPMNGLDSEGIDLIRNLLLNYKGENRCIIISSHNKEDLDYLCDEIYELADAKLIKNK